MANKLCGALPLSAWRGALTVFGGFYNPLPGDELEDLTFAVLIHNIAPSGGPVIGVDKDLLPFFVPTVLREAPLTETMQQKTGLAHGKQRSSRHVVAATWLVIDVDGLTEANFEELQRLMRDAGITFAVYSTHSHGRGDKPGFRARLIVPVDRAMSPDEYRLAWLGFDLCFCNGEIAAKDDSGKALHQQQGIWSAHPERAHLAFRIVHKAGVASADALIAEGSKVAPPKRTYDAAQADSSHGGGGLAEFDKVKLSAALGQIDANDYTEWVRVCACLVALSRVFGGDARSIWIGFSESAEDSAKAKNDRSGTDPEAMFDRMAPDMSVDAAMGTLMGMAKAAAFSALNKAHRSGGMTDKARGAIAHLRRFHQSSLNQWIAEHSAKEAA